MDIQDWQSGVWKGTIQFTGPTGQTINTSFAVHGPNGQSSGYSCGYLSGGDLHQVTCGLTIQFPVGSAPGAWKVTRLAVTDNVGNTTVARSPQSDAITLTTDTAITASNFSLTPDPLNDWGGNVTETLTMSVSGASGGVSDIYVDQNDNSSCLAQSPTPTVNADGSVSVYLTVFQGAAECGPKGIAIVDGAGNVALYGAEYDAPDPGIDAKQVPDTGPAISSAVVSQASISQAELADTAITTTVDFTAPTAPITMVCGYVQDSHGIQVSQGCTDYLDDVQTGPETIDLDVPADTPVGTYTVTYLFVDEGYKHWQFGGVYGQAFPGSPLTFTITD